MKNRSAPSSSIAESFTRRDLDILALLAQDLTDREIADRLTLALSTVKWYARQVYTKLGVSQRSEVSERAHDLGLLQPVPTSDTKPTQPRNNLPAQLTSFIGREREIAELCLRIEEKAARLYTLTGSGGIGKTRLALQVAANLQDSFPDGVWWVELAPLSDPILIPQTVITALELVEQAGRTALTFLTDYLRHKQLLLILDNCEHLVEACAELAAGLLRNAPRLTILMTSREILGMSGEMSYRLPSLQTPDLSNLPPLEELKQLDAVQLFVDRARFVDPTFEITPENASAVAQITQRLDGIPLAIELAAARARVMSAAQIAQRLQDAFSLLTAGSRTALPRHQTLQATIDWSYALITPLEKTLLQRLAVFSGGWSLEACEGACADEAGLEGCAGKAIRNKEVLNLLTRLVDRSLVIADVRSAGMRYRMLETIRQYAREKLLESGCGEQARNRHLAYFARLSGESIPHLRGNDQVEWLDRLELELDNFRTALEWSRAAHIELGLKIAADMRWFWHIRALFEEAVAHFEKLLAAEVAMRGAGSLEGERALQRARALRTLADHLNYTNHPLAVQIQTFFQESIAILRGLGPAANGELGISLIDFWWRHGWLAGNLDQPTPLRSEFLEIFEREKNSFQLSEYYNFLHYSNHNKGRLEEAEAFDEKSLALCRENGDMDGIMDRCYNLSFFAWYKGDHARADALLQEALAACLKVKNRWFELVIRNELSVRAFSRGDYSRAVRLAEESLLGNRELNYLIGMDEALDTLQSIAWSRSELDESLRFGRERLELYAGQLFSPLTEFQRNNQIGSHLYLGRVAISQGDLAQAERLLKISAGFIAGNEGWLDFHVEIHQLLAWIALLTRQKKPPDAARLLGAVDSFYRQTAPSFSPRERSEYLEDLAAAQTELGPEAFSAHFTTGQAMSLAEAIAFVTGIQ